MTHDELLKKIEFSFYLHPKNGLDMLRAAVELHKPTTHGTCSVCLDSPLADSSDYPCETIQAIEKELK